MSVSVQVKGDFGIKESVQKYAKFKKNIPRIIGVNSVNHFKKGFSKGGGQTNASKSGWEQRQHRKGGNTLVKRGVLQKDIRLKKAKFEQTVVGTSNITKNYAEIHNEGGKIKITKKMRGFFWAQFKKTKDEYWKNLALHKGSFIDIPQREYIGHSNSLDNDNVRILNKELDKVFK